MLNYEHLILASKSSRRKDILKQVGIPFKTAIPNVDEKEYLSGTETNPISIALKIAQAKAEDVAKNHLDKLVLAADTMILLGDRIIGKPNSEEEARQTLMSLSNNEHKVITSYNLLNHEIGMDILDYDETLVSMYPIEAWEVENYLKKNEYKDAAGAYKIQGEFAKYVKWIKGSYHNVMGLPISKIFYAMKKAIAPEYLSH